MDCPGTNIHNRQYYTTKYVSSNYSLPLIIQDKIEYSDYSDDLVITFDNKDFFTGTPDIGVSKYQKTLVINGIQYSAIGIITSYNNKDTIYFSKDYGVVRIVSKGNLWNIIP